MTLKDEKEFIVPRINVMLLSIPKFDYVFKDKFDFHSEFANRLKDYNITLNEMFSDYINDRVDKEWYAVFKQTSVENSAFIIDIYCEVKDFPIIEELFRNKMPTEFIVRGYFYSGETSIYLKE